jgi:hypothetical protein
MRRICVAILVLVLSPGAAGGRSEPLCVFSSAAMPETWRPSGKVREGMTSAEPWSDDEAKDSVYAIRTGLNEMISLFSRRPSAIPALWEDSVGALVEVTYSSANTPAFDAAARDAARRNLTVLVARYLRRDPHTVRCVELERLLPLAIYAHKLYPDRDSRTSVIVALTNSAFRACGSLEAALGQDYKEIMSRSDADVDDVFDLVIWSLLFIEAEVYPDITLLAESRALSPVLWRYLESHPIAGARAFRNGASDEDFIDDAYLATHIAYIPTGNHRHPIYVQDSPRLYRFHRENFYPVLAMGELDLVAEIVDTLRQYGCTPENDLQVRDGTRYLLKVFHDGGDRWMTYREPGQTDADVDDYDLVHKAWTGILGVRARVLEPAEAGTYGGVVRRWLSQPR